jgi:DNA end-binding protein Ku
MRAIWSGAIGFGLINIPVKLYSGSEEERLDLDMLDKRDRANVHFQRVNAKTGEEVAWEDVVKGYKYNNKYVVLTDEDFEKASPKKNKLIEIDAFAEERLLDPALYEAPYFLAPEKGGEKAYALLREALRESGKVGLGTYVMRNREHLCALRPDGDALMLMKLRFEEELRDASELDLPKEVTIKPAEMKMALAIMEQMTPKKLNLAKYKDTYTSELKKLIRQKAKGREMETPTFTINHSKAKDLMAQLKASLEAKTKSKAS